MTQARNVLLVALATVLTLAGCGDDTRPPARDDDGGLLVDGNSDVDLGDRDGSLPDLGVTDGGETDGGEVDGARDACGDGVLATTGEDCDDGNVTAGDGCDTSCAVETGFTCDTADPSVCTAICGDGLVLGAEAGATGCDDGNTTVGDGCNASCAVETGFSCAGTPSTCTPGCGDGIVVGTEGCDDGDMMSGDGCSSACAAEPGFTCTGSPSTCVTVCGDGAVGGAEACDDGNVGSSDGCSATCVVETGFACTGAPSACVSICGDGVLVGAEACDDGNAIAGDGCSATCGSEAGYACAGAPSVCATVCGDGRIAGAEMCDDGGTTSGNGCSATCTVEAGFMCVGAPSVCMTSCGDGVRAGAEMCDDGGTTSGNGCSATCTVEAGFVCAGSPSVCATVCGDGVRAGAEACDDGGTTSGNGCSATCTVEAGFTCVGAPSVCTTTCGDGVRADAEACDDGGTTSGNGCSATCTVETGWTCTGTTPSVCAPICGDALRVGAEACDDGNTVAGDCCSATCTREATIPIDSGARTASCEFFGNNNTAATALPLGTFPQAGYLAGGIRPVADGDFFPIVLTRTANLRVETFGPASSTSCGAAGVPDTLIEVFGIDGTTILATDDDDGISNCSLIEQVGDPGVRNLAPGTYYIRVRNFADAAIIPLYTVGVSACGDGVITGPETCDDGFTQNGDGCSASCAIEAGFVCTGTTSACSYTVNYSGGVVAVPDNGAAVNVPVTINAPTCRVNSVSTTHAWRTPHAYAGDIIARVIGPTAATTTLYNRVGADRDLTGPYTFAAGGAVWPPVAGDPIPSGNYNASYAPFLGTIANGVWNLNVQDAFVNDTGSIGAFSVTITCDPQFVVVTFPSTTSTVNNPAGALGAGGGAIKYESGDFVEQTFTTTTPTAQLALNFQMSDGTSGCAVGQPLAWNVLVNGIVVGTYGFAGGSLMTPRSITQSYSFASVPAGPVTVRLQATTTVCSGGGSWNWVAGGSATLR